MLDEFLTTLFNVLRMFFYMIPAFILTKIGKADSSHSKTISAILVYISLPAMIINSFQSIEFTWSNLGKISLFFLVSFILMGLTILILFLIFRKKYDESKYRILSIGAALGNVGFLGTPLISGLYPNSSLVLCYSSIYTIAQNIIAFTVGVYALTTNKQFITPFPVIYNLGMISLAFGLIFYVFEWHFPTILGEAVSILSKMSTPLCMHILGMRLASVKIAELFKRPFVYITCLLKLLIYPLFGYLLVYFFKFFNNEFKASVFILSGAPCAAIILSLSELYNTEQELSANVILVSTLACVVTLPVLTIILAATAK